MPTSLTVTTVLGNPDNTQNCTTVRGTVTLTGSYPTGGDTLSFASVSDQIKSNSLPLEVRLYETTPAANGAGSKYAFNFLPGTTNANGVMTVCNGTTEFSAGAYGTPPFSITNFQLSFTATFPNGI
jgi:hypothetical protein